MNQFRAKMQYRVLARRPDRGRGTSATLLLAFLLGLGLNYEVYSDSRGPGRQERRQKSEEKQAARQREELADLSQKLERRLKAFQPGPDHEFLHARAQELLERTRAAVADRYLFNRLAGATDALLEASEKIFESREAHDPPEDDQQRTALALQRYYFRVQQGDYFAGLSGEQHAALYLRHARSLYQQARTAYDRSDYRKARKLGEAASHIIKALENLAQASVRIPEPPRLK